MLVKCIKLYHDTKLNRIVNVNEELNVDEKRAEVLVSHKVCEVIPTTPEVDTEVTETADTTTTEVDTESEPKPEPVPEPKKRGKK